MFSKLKNFFANNKNNLSSKDVLFLSKDDCHLCDEALGVLLQAKKIQNFNLEIIKIQEGDAWHSDYWDKIPVVFIAGRLAFKYRLNVQEFLLKLNR